MPKQSHDNDNDKTIDDDFDFLSEESAHRPVSKENVDVFDALLDQTLEIKPVAKLPIIRKPVPVSESGPNLSPAEREGKHSRPPARPSVTQPAADKFDDDFGFLDETVEVSARRVSATERVPSSEFGEDSRAGVHSDYDEYDNEKQTPKRKSLWLAIAGVGVLAVGGFVAFQSGILNSNSNSNSSAGATPTPTPTPTSTSTTGVTATADSDTSIDVSTTIDESVANVTAGTTAQSAADASSSISEQFRLSLARIEGQVARGEFDAASAAIDALDSRVFGYGQPEFIALQEQILARDTGGALEAEKQRLAAEAVRADQQRIAEESRLAEEAEQAEQVRLAEEERLASEALRAEESRLAAEAQLIENARLAAQQAEADRLAAEVQQVEAARQAEEALRVEEARLAAEARQAEEARRVEAARQAETVRLAAEAQQIEDARKAEEARQAEALLAEARQAEEARLAAEAARQQEAAESAERAAQARQTEEARLQAEAERLERDRLEAIAAEQRANARRAASDRATQARGEATVASPSSSVSSSSTDREATDRLSSAATTDQGLAVQSRRISDSETEIINSRLQAVKEAIRAQNMERLTALTNIDGKRVQAFYQLFTNSSQIDVRVDGSRAQASVGVVVGTLRVSRVLGNDGSERVVPANLRNFTLTTRRVGNGWSKFSW